MRIAAFSDIHGNYPAKGTYWDEDNNNWILFNFRMDNRHITFL